ncbi:SDR family oxidoreductase [Arcicella lustrica]|uniref:SDR family NAD(P)-dependent oxidoreductase n=1 Tax=Arcicella lustrica TaxID=2984196 RepID=A0ABU5SJY7_9BACT|nr:SDR family NAD(P)-dependent oxidoreductase [Arcicella sp. DC25W]MEA5427586.1 SDR family NAD(P)-dependent oxidoreductase [Arcicella sp. DC25W]
MKTQNNTILITGGSAGIGFEMAKLFSQNGNKVIITGRNADRLAKAAAQLENVTSIVSDVTNAEDTAQLVDVLKKDFPSLNIVINNAGFAHVYNLIDIEVEAFQKAQEEIVTNYLSIVRLNEKLLPLLKQNESSAIVNVSSIVSFAPALSIPTYSSSKAALHSYSQILRFALAKSTNVKVFELMPPLVDTDFSSEIGGNNGIKPNVVAERLFEGLANDEFEIHVGFTEDFYKLYLSSPEKALEALNS